MGRFARVANFNTTVGHDDSSGGSRDRVFRGRTDSHWTSSESGRVSKCYRKDKANAAQTFQRNKKNLADHHFDRRRRGGRKQGTVKGRKQDRDDGRGGGHGSGRRGRREEGRGRGRGRGNRYAINDRGEIRVDLAQNGSDDPLDISLHLGLNLEKMKKYLEHSTKENENRHRRCLETLDRAFQNRATPALLLNAINAMKETEFVRHSVDRFKVYLEGERSKETDTTFIEAVCTLLRIMTRVYELNPSATSFIYGSHALVSELMDKIRNSLKYNEQEPEVPSVRTVTAETNKEMDTTSSCFPENKLDVNNFEPSLNDTVSIDIVTSERQMPFKSEKEVQSYERMDLGCQHLYQLFADLDNSVKSCSQRRKKQKESPPSCSSDNQTEDFRDIPIFPRLGDLNGKIKPDLKVNKPKGGYASVDEYLDVQFRLLREDFVEPLRDGIRAYIGQIFSKEKKKIQEIKVYENTQILSSLCSDGLIHILSFDVSKLRHIQWNMSKRLKNGSLICLSADNFQTCYFAVIADTKASHKKQGQLHVKFALEAKQVQAVLGKTFTMIESTAYFEAYRPVLLSLQDITENDLPFKDHIVGCKTEIIPPKYLLRENLGNTFDLRCLMDPDFKVHSDIHKFVYPKRKMVGPNKQISIDSDCLKNVNILKSQWPMEAKLNLDTSQLVALKSALTREVSVIQGPPGCGKTHLGLMIAKVLLYNKTVWKHENGTRAQMLVVCYTNHALDQFMEGICSFFDGDIVRVGGRGTNAALEPFNLKSIKREIRKTEKLNRRLRNSFVRRSRISAFEGAHDLQQDLNIEFEKIRILKENIVHENSLKEVIGFDKYKQFEWSEKKLQRLPSWLEFRGNSVIVEWLGIIALAKNIQENSYNKHIWSQTKKNRSRYDERLIVKNTEVSSEINFKLQQDLKDNKRDELEAFIKENVTLDIHEVQKVDKDYFPNQVKRERVELERRKLAKVIQQNLLSIEPMSEVEAMSVTSICSKHFKEEQRWALYLYWVKKKCNMMYNANKKKLQQYQEADQRLKEVYMIEEINILRKADIIGMTITGAAKYKNALREIQPKIMIVEEAAEVLESHLVSNLTSSCEQLIMIGDHKQLKPKPNVYRLEKDYNLDLSLFERMVRNGINCDCLQIQHRMRPEIADNIRPFYQALIDHDIVKQYKSIQGISQNIFFIDHCIEEKKDDELKSYTNLHEVKYIVALCKYLLLQDYDSSEITILTTYNGQMYIMKKAMKENRLADVKIKTVDNYQGEENEIILLSLVRSNDDGRIGYLSRDNRVCVALSRAKKGLYIIGNSKCLSSARSALSGKELWKPILENMRQKGSFGKALPLSCQNHPNDKGIMAEKSDDFLGAPEGGCKKPCDIRLDCGHACGKFCHIKNIEHLGIICRKSCTRKCKNGHQCLLECWQECVCKETIIITLQPCGHTVNVECNTDLKTYSCPQICNKTLACGHICHRMCKVSCICMELVKVILPCEHEATIPCSVNPRKHNCNEDIEVLRTDCGHLEKRRCSEALKRTECKHVCNLPLECGHVCMERCGDDQFGVENTTNKPRVLSKCLKRHRSNCSFPCDVLLKCGHKCKGSCSSCYKGRWHQLCKEACNCNLACGHTCQGKCGYCLPCTENCRRKCRHTFCRRKCIEICIPCKCNCVWKCEHFACTNLCGSECDRPRCNLPCKKTLQCKHKCIGLCGDPCPLLCRICDKDEFTNIRFGGEYLSRTRFVQLQDCGHLIKYDIMDEYMDIDEGATLKRCPICKKPVLTTNGNRYENIVNRIHERLNKIKQQTFQDYQLRATLENVTKKNVLSSDTIWDLGIARYCYTYCDNYDHKSFEDKFQTQPNIIRNFFACFDAINAINQSTILSFLESFSTEKIETMNYEGIFEGGSLCLSSAQHRFEIEREILRFLDRLQMQYIRKTFKESKNCNREINKVLDSIESITLQDGLYSEKNRKQVWKALGSLPKKNSLVEQLIKVSITTVPLLKSVSDIPYGNKKTNEHDQITFRLHGGRTTMHHMCDERIDYNSAIDLRNSRILMARNLTKYCVLNPSLHAEDSDDGHSLNTSLSYSESEDDVKGIYMDNNKIGQKLNIELEEGEIVETYEWKIGCVTERDIYFKTETLAFEECPSNEIQGTSMDLEDGEIQNVDDLSQTNSRNKGNSHTIKLITWPGVPYFHCEQSHFHLKLIPATDDNVKGPSSKRPGASEPEKEQGSKKFKTETNGQTSISPSNIRKRVIDKTCEEEPPIKKSKYDGKIVFTIPKKSSGSIPRLPQFEADTEVEMEENRKISVKGTYTRKVVMKSKTTECETTTEQKSEKNAVKDTRQLVPYDDLDLNEDFESIYANESNFQDRGIKLREYKRHNQHPESNIEKATYTRCIYESNTDISASSQAKITNKLKDDDLRNTIRKNKRYDEEHILYTRDNTSCCDKTDSRNKLRKRASDINKDHESIDRCEQSSEPRLDSKLDKESKDSNDLRTFLESKSVRQGGNVQEQQYDVDIEDDEWLVVDEA